MPEKNIKPLVLGDGLLGSEIVKQSGWDYISRKKNGFDFCDIFTYSHLLSGYGTIINCIANTDTYSDNRKKHWETNFLAVCDLTDLCSKKGKKMIHISTDYIYAHSKENASEQDVPSNCANWYAYCKLLADGYVQARADDYLIIRTSFKNCPFPYPKAITTQIGNFECVHTIAGKIIKLVERNAFGVYNVGRKNPWSIYDMALDNTIGVEPMDEVLSDTMPTNITMDTSRMRRFLNED
jgi:dTDP-4-dehydrorhamnose reductase